MLPLPRALSCTPVFYFKLAAGGSGRARGAGWRKVIVSVRRRDSFKSWGRECSSAPQGHWYFTAFTFLHDKLMPRIDGEVWERRKKKKSCHAFKAHLDISCPLAAHLRRASLAWRPSVSQRLLRSLADEGLRRRRSRCVSRVTHLCFINPPSAGRRC